MPIQLAIPTYRRAKTIQNHTLYFLNLQHYPAELITLFVASEEEKVLYQRSVPRHLYGEIVVGVLGLAEQRNFIRDYYDEGQILCQMDDDVHTIKMLSGNFLDLIERGVKELEEGCGLFGVLPNDDTRRLKPDTTYHLTHILGSFFVLRNHKTIDTQFSEKEDYLRSLQYFNKYGKVARYRGAGVRTTYNQGSGGLIAPDRELRMKKGAEDLVRLYPGQCIEVMKNNMPDVKLNWRAKSAALLEQARDESRSEDASASEQPPSLSA